MTVRRLIRYAFLALCLAWSSHPLHCADTPAAIVTNQNRSPAGQLRDGVLSLHLEIGQGVWHPESDTGLEIPIYAFGETGAPLQDPGPLIRVPQGTRIHATVHNALPVVVTVHGLDQRPGNAERALELPPGATRQVRFVAGVPGTYFYWATTSGFQFDEPDALTLRQPVESQLSGAFVIDPSGAVPNDGVFVIGVWLKPLPGSVAQIVSTINGKSWPYTQRLTFHAGDHVHWRWVNASADIHAFHLHGHFYHVDSVGDAEHYQPYAKAARPLVVTHYVPAGATYDMSWVPQRPGRWLYHCHMLVHIMPQMGQPTESTVSAHGPMSAQAPGSAPSGMGMGGLVLGITILPGPHPPQPVAWRAEHNLQLIISPRKSGLPRYALEVRDLSQPSSPPAKAAAPPLIGPPIVLTRGQPSEIEVINHTQDPTSIHWHGIELESYYDGVPGWSGDETRTAPPVLPGKSFVARIDPPRAGTFIYHTHWHDIAQLQNGLYGPLIVLAPGEKLDPARDQTFVFGMGRFQPFGLMLLINGNPQPGPLHLSAGRKCRLRLINIAPNQANLHVSLRDAGVPVHWRIIAKDGADLPAALIKPSVAEMIVSVGETYDVEYEAAKPEELSLEAYLPGPAKRRATQALLFAPPSHAH